MEIVVPHGMLEAAVGELNYPGRYKCPGDETRVREILQTSLAWLAENPIVPTEKQLSALSKGYPPRHEELRPLWFIAEWQRRMFLAPEPETPQDAIKRILTKNGYTPTDAAIAECVDAVRGKEGR